MSLTPRAIFLVMFSGTCILMQLSAIVAARIGGVRAPLRKHLVTRQDFIDKVANITWYQFYFGSTLPSVFLNGEFEFLWSEDQEPTVTEVVKAELNGSCVTEADFGGAKTFYPTGSGRRAEFETRSPTGGIYRSYFGSDLDSYVFTFDCLSGKPAFTCPFADTFVSLYVKSVRPDSLPLQRALWDLQKATGLTLDEYPNDFPFRFTLGENQCPE